MNDKKSMFEPQEVSIQKSIPTIVLLAVLAWHIILWIFKGDPKTLVTFGTSSGTNVVAMAGYFLAVVFAGKRFLDDKNKKIVKLILFVTAVICAVIAISIAVKAKDFKIFGGPIPGAIMGGIILILMVAFGFNKFDYLETCSTGKYVLSVIGAIIIAPIVAVAFNGLIGLLIELAIVVVVLFMAPSMIAAGYKQHGSKQKFYAKDGSVHDNMITMQNRNDSIDKGNPLF